MRRSIALIGTGGSSGTTLQDLEEPLRREFGDVEFLFIDTQPFNLRTGGTTRYSGSATVKTASIRDAGMVPYTRSWSTNMLLNGGPVMTRKLFCYASSMLEKRHDAMLICHDRLYLEQAFVKAAQAMGTPSILVQEGPFVHVGPRNAKSIKLRVKRALAPVLSGIALSRQSGTMALQGTTASSSPLRIIGRAGLPRACRQRSSMWPAWFAMTTWKAVREARSAASEGPLRLLYLFQPFGEHGKVDPAVAERVQLAMVDGIVRAARTVPLHLTIEIHPRSNLGSVSRVSGKAARDLARGRPVQRQDRGGHIAQRSGNWALLQRSA